jgi:C_GCAxxG_C_C family probable redox protein
MSNSEKATEIFNSGYNCAQAVILAYTDRFNIDKEHALQLTCGFGSGIARMQETCGAVTGAVMVIGLAVGEKIPVFPDRKEKAYELIQEFVKRFLEKNNSIKCRDLLNCDVNTEEGMYLYDLNELHEKVCSKCISDAVEILDTLIAKAN